MVGDQVSSLESWALNAEACGSQRQWPLASQSAP